MSECVYEPRPDPKFIGPPEHAPSVVYCLTHEVYGGCQPTTAPYGGSDHTEGV